MGQCLNRCCATEVKVKPHAAFMCVNVRSNSGESGHLRTNAFTSGVHSLSLIVQVFIRSSFIHSFRRANTKVVNTRVCERHSECRGRSAVLSRTPTGRFTYHWLAARRSCTLDTPTLCSERPPAAPTDAPRTSRYSRRDSNGRGSSSSFECSKPEHKSL